MVDTRKQWRILEVENGYVVLDDHPGREYLSGDKWVAQDVPSLMDLVGDLVTGKHPRLHPLDEKE